MREKELYEKQRKLISEYKKTESEKIILKLIHDYEGLLVKLANNTKKKFHNSPLTFNDYFQFLTFSFIERTKKYDFNSKMKYSSYIQTFLSLDVNNYAKKYLTKSHKLMNYSDLNNFEDSINYSYYDDHEIGFDDLNYRSLTEKQKYFFVKLLENGGSVKKTSKALNIPEKTIYRHRKEVIKKLNKINGIE